MGFGSFFKDIFSPVSQEEEEQYLVVDDSFEPTSDYEQPAKKNVARSDVKMKMMLFEPRTFEEGHTVIDHLKQQQAAVINLRRLPQNYAQRVIDLLSGGVYALGGQIASIGEDVFLCTPSSVRTDGEISNYHGEE